VLGAANSQPWLGVGVTLLVLAWHFFQSKHPKYELLLILAALLVGALFDNSCFP